MGRNSRGAVVALVHATCYADDRQVMEYLARHLAARGLDPRIVGPAHLRWDDDRVRFDCDWCRGSADAALRFFPAEWLESLPRRHAWRRSFAGGRTPQSNPTHALVLQSKRLPLVWDRLVAPMTTWRESLPVTVDPRAAEPGGERWVLKPALGRVGEGVGIRGVTPERAWGKIVRRARLRPGEWVAQRRFEALPWRSALGVFYPCIGVFVVDGVAAGAYGRVAARPLIDEHALDVAVLVEGSLAGETAVRSREAV
jgi:glutathionylspermidine synthase